MVAHQAEAKIIKLFQDNGMEAPIVNTDAVSPKRRPMSKKQRKTSVVSTVAANNGNGASSVGHASNVCRTMWMAIHSDRGDDDDARGDGDGGADDGCLYDDRDRQSRSAPLCMCAHVTNTSFAWLHARAHSNAPGGTVTKGKGGGGGFGICGQPRSRAAAPPDSREGRQGVWPCIHE